MRALNAILSEIYGLFVDDGRVALFIVGWLAIAGLVLPQLPLSADARSVMLVAGLAIILAASTVRAAACRRQ